VVIKHLKKIKKKLKTAKAKHKGYKTLAEYEKHRERVKTKERTEREKFKLWEIEEKYKHMQKEAKKPKKKGKGAMGLLKVLAGEGGGPFTTDADPLGLFPKKRKKRRKKKR